MSRTNRFYLIVYLFTVISCGAPVIKIQTPFLVTERGPAALEGCRLVKSQEADVYKSFYKEKALDEVWYDLDYARNRLEEHRSSGLCDSSSAP